MSPGGFSSPAERWREIYRLQDLGLSVRAIAEQLRISDRTVHRATARRRGYTLRPWRRWDAELDQLVRAALDDGWSYKEIARTYRVNAHNLSVRYPGRGWTPAQKSEYAAMSRRLNMICETHAVKMEQQLELAA